MQKINVLAISGSTRKSSSNGNLIHAIANLGRDVFDIDIYDELTTLPHFNPDDDHEPAPAAVASFRARIRQADAVLICTPEYAIGVPGSLKNAIDWTVSSMEFSKKPVALITASLSGERAHQSLLGTLLIIESRITASTALLISYVKTKVNEQGISDNETLVAVQKLIDSLKDLVEQKENIETLAEPLLLNAGVNSGN
jgi:chromate reductase, NAD(P)H dehydrogenase (quinone)